MKIYTYYTDSHKPFFENYFSPSVVDLEVVAITGNQECQTGSYYQEGWKTTTMKKVDVFIKACLDNQGDIFVYSDVDIQFFGPLKDSLVNELGDYDLAVQNDYLGGMCSGFFVCRSNERTLKMFKSMKENESQYLEDQHALNMNLHFVKYKSLSHRFWTFGIYKTQWKGQNFDIPEDILMHHANWTEGISNKRILLDLVRTKMEMKKKVMSMSSNYQDFLYDYFSEFRPSPTYPVYPPYHRGNYLEDYFCEYFRSIKTDHQNFLIPVSWTTCYIQNVNLELLQEKLLSLDKSKHYFVVSQHDDAVKEYLPPNTQRFCAGGNGGGIPLPLVCSKIPEEKIFKFKKDEKDILCSFVGSITHPIRQSMIQELEGRSEYYLKYGGWKNKLQDDEFDLFAEIVGRSTFTLCPRGYGKNSFRMYECMQLGSIPIYIYDDDWRPFKDIVNWDLFSISIHYSNLSKLADIIQSIPKEKIDQMSSNLTYYYENFFSLSSMSNIIVNKI